MHTFKTKFGPGDRIKLKNSTIKRIGMITGVQIEFPKDENNHKKQCTNYIVSLRNCEDEYIMAEDELILFAFTNVISLF